MNDSVDLAGAFSAGLLLGVLFFGGLLWTTRNGMASDSPALWFLGSFICRTAIVLAGFYLVAGSDWQRGLVCLLGWMIARSAVLRLSRPPLLLPVDESIADRKDAP